MSGRVLRRPWGGWRARQWRREVGAWLLFAWIYLACSATCGVILELIDFVAAAASS